MALRGCGAEASTVRTAAELETVDALVLPGGESTTMSRLLQVFDLEMPLRERLAAGMPTLSTCAGLILMSREVLDGRPDQIALGVLDVSVRRNGYGRQVEVVRGGPSGRARSEWRRFEPCSSARRCIERAGPDAEVIATFGDNPVAVAQGPHLGLCFHPEMTDDSRLHQLFLERAKQSSR